MSNLTIAEQYESGRVSGWGGPQLAKESFNLLRSSFVEFPQELVYGATRKRFLYQIVRKVLGKDLININQEIGDCVSWGGRNATVYVSCVQKEISGDKIIVKDVFTPYYYGTGRVYIGGNRLQGDGSLGSWMASAVMRYGTLFVDDENVPRYSGSVAKQWGSSQSVLDRYKPTASDNLVKSAARISSWNELVAAIVNGYPCTIASQVGFEMVPNRNGFHEHSGQQWAHQMCLVGIDDEYQEPYALIRNSWGPHSHGKLVNFYDSDDVIPGGYLRVRKNWIEKMIREGECFAYSGFQGFPDNTKKLDRSDFRLV